VDCRRNVLDVARGAEPVQAAHQRARQQLAAHVVGQGLDLPRVVARILGQDLHAFRQPQQVRAEQSLAAPQREPLVPHDRHGPEREHEAHLLLVVLDDDVEVARRREGRVLCHLRRVAGGNRRCLRAHDGGVEALHDDHDDDQRKDLEHELAGLELLHGALGPVGQMSTGKATSKSGRTFSVGSKCCGEPFAATGLAAGASSPAVAAAALSSPPACAPAADSVAAGSAGAGVDGGRFCCANARPAARIVRPISGASDTGVERRSLLFGIACDPEADVVTPAVA